MFIFRHEDYLMSQKHGKYQPRHRVAGNLSNRIMESLTDLCRIVSRTYQGLEFIPVKDQANVPCS